MDYSTNTTLIRQQWEELREPKGNSFWDDEEDGLFKRAPLIVLNLNFPFCQKDAETRAIEYLSSDSPHFIPNQKYGDWYLFVYTKINQYDVDSLKVWQNFGGKAPKWVDFYRIRKNLWSEEQSIAQSIYKINGLKSNNSGTIFTNDLRVSSYCNDSVPVADPPVPPKVYDFAAYVAFPMAYAAPGKNDDSPTVKLLRKIMKNKVEKGIQVGHTGVCLFKSDTVSKRVKVDYYDFGRFDPTEKEKGNGIQRYFDLGFLEITVDQIDNTYKITNKDSIEILIDNIPYFANHQDVYDRKEIAVVPIPDYQKAKNLAENNFYEVCTFGFGNGKSFCTDFVHDVINAGGISMDDVSAETVKMEKKMGDWLLAHLFKTNLMKFWDDGDEELKKFPLPINYAKRLQNQFPAF